MSSPLSTPEESGTPVPSSKPKQTNTEDEVICDDESAREDDALEGFPPTVIAVVQTTQNSDGVRTFDEQCEIVVLHRVGQHPVMCITVALQRG